MGIPAVLTKTSWIWMKVSSSWNPFSSMYPLNSEALMESLRCCINPGGHFGEPMVVHLQGSPQPTSQSAFTAAHRPGCSPWHNAAFYPGRGPAQEDPDSASLWLPEEPHEPRVLLNRSWNRAIERQWQEVKSQRNVKNERTTGSPADEDNDVSDWNI